ncbi:hypothetical protein [Candidatus Nitrotoga fabula]|uniref:hypothetical protein n=1 Tax=Candidatus Nitrotoga fabula TaxID=2182327 RepID=UPI001BB4708D|nr:hypothetical protein [Candidatus Nitrotoga fabula]
MRILCWLCCLVLLLGPSISAGRYRIKAREYDPAAYTDIVVSEPTFADTSLPNPVTAPTVTGLVLLEEIYQNANGIWTSRIKAQWSAVDFPFLRHYRIEVYLLGNLVHSAVSADVLYRTPPVQDLVTYVVKVAAVSMVGSVGTAAEENVYIDGKYLPPSDVPSISVFEAGGRVYAQWDPATDADIWRYEVRYGPTAGSWDTATLIDRVDALRLVTDLIPVGTWKIYVKALDSVGLYSGTAASQTFTVTSDAAAFLVESVDSDTPTLTNMTEYDIFDGKRHWVSEDGVAWNTKYSSNMDTYTNPLASYHNSMTSEWLGESEDFAMLLSGQWTGTADVAAISGSIASSIGFSSDGAAWSYLSGLSHKENARFARLKHEALTTSTLKVTVPTQKIRLDAIPRDEVGAGSSSALGPVTITLENQYVAVKRLTVTPEGTTARMAVVDNIVLATPTTFDVYVFDAAGNLIASDFRWLWQGV